MRPALKNLLGNLAVCCLGGFLLLAFAWIGLTEDGKRKQR